MSQRLYPLRFEPIYQYRLWGGRRLSDLLRSPLPGKGPIGEAWVLSDREDHPSRVANGPLRGQTIGQLMQHSRDQLMGKLAMRFSHFPLLLKFLDAQEMLSVQVHPGYAPTGASPPDSSSKTEAWVVIEAAKDSRIYAGLKPGTTAYILRQSLSDETLPDHLSSIIPKRGDGVFIPAGTVHSLGGDVVVFEVQQNSDVTFRLYDWDHVDEKTGKPRELQIDQALACIDFVDSLAGLVTPAIETVMPKEREKLFDCNAFRLWRLRGESLFNLTAEGVPHVLVCVDGAGQIEHGGDTYAVGRGDVWLLPAVIGSYDFRAEKMVSLLDIEVPA